MAPPRAALALAVLLMVDAGMHFMPGGEAAEKAVRVAREKLGGGYKYNVTALQWWGRHYRASVIAHDGAEIRSVEVQWSQQGVCLSSPGKLRGQPIR